MAFQSLELMVPDEGYSRNASSPLTLISTFCIANIHFITPSTVFESVLQSNYHCMIHEIQQMVTYLWTFTLACLSYTRVVLYHLRIECILLKFHWGMQALTEVHFQWSAAALHWWKCSSINAFMPQWNFIRMHSILIIIFKSHQNLI